MVDVQWQRSISGRHVVCGQKTVASSSLTGEVVTRRCVPTCNEGSQSVGNLASGHIYCCNDKDLCNGAVKPSSQLPVAAALFVGVAIAARLL